MKGIVRYGTQKKLFVIPFRFNQFESSKNCTCANHEIIIFWFGTEILLYVHFTYFNIFYEDPSGSFTKICDVTLPRLLSHRIPISPLFLINHLPFHQLLLD